jgi:hypothetical protein
MKLFTKTLALGCLILMMPRIKAQTRVQKPAWLYTEMNDSIKMRIYNSLDSLYAGISKGKPDSNLLDKTNYRLNLSVIRSLKENEKKDSTNNFYKKELINFYRISSDQYFMSIAYMANKVNEIPELKLILNLVVKNEKEKITFSIPLSYLTKDWNTKTTGDITYYFPHHLNTTVANTFNAKNTQIATKLGLKPEKLKFYMCQNQQEIINLFGREYDLDANGRTREGYGVGANTIFSIMNNEDFSHDVFHFYSAKIRGEIKRNHTVEEGMAYFWGNAYYTKANGEMVEHKELVLQLKAYIKQNPGINLLKLFINDTNIFTQVPGEISVKSTISGLLCMEVEQKKGIAGIKKLICCGKGDEAFFKTLDELIAVNTSNFDKEVRKLIDQYK